MEDEYDGKEEPIKNQKLLFEMGAGYNRLVGDELRPLVAPLHYREDINHWHCHYLARERIGKKKMISNKLIPREHVLWVEM